MKVQLGVLINSQNSIDKLAKCQGIIGKKAFRILRNIRKINDELKTFDDARKNLIDKYGKKDKDGQIITKDDGHGQNIVVFNSSDDRNKFNKEVNDIFMDVVDIDLDKFTEDDLDNSNLTVEDLLSLSYMVDFGDEDEKENKKDSDGVKDDAKEGNHPTSSPIKEDK